MSPESLDALMTRLGLTNADLVKVSTEQLSFKNVQKGRAGKRVTPNIQDKILTALIAAKPDLQVRKRDLFRYEASPALVEAIQGALSLTTKRKIKYPQFISLLAEGGVTGYTAEVAANRYTFYGVGGEFHVEQGPAITEESPGHFNEAALRAAIADAQKEAIDHPTFLKRIHEAGIGVYEVNIRKLRIDYKGEERSHREKIPPYVPESESVTLNGAEPATQTPLVPKLSNKKKKAAARAKKKKKPGIVRTTRKKRMLLNKLYRAKKQKARRPKGKPSNPKTKRGPKK